MKKLLLVLLCLLPLTAGAQKPTLGVNLGHANAVTSLRFSPDSRYLLSSAANDALKLWEVNSGKLLATSPAITEMEGAVFLFDQGRYAAFSTPFYGWGNDNPMPRILWDIAAGSLKDARPVGQRVVEPELPLFLEEPGNNEPPPPSLGDQLSALMEPQADLSFPDEGNDAEATPRPAGFLPDGKGYFTRTEDQLELFTVAEAKSYGMVSIAGVPDSFQFSSNAAYIFSLTNPSEYTVWQLSDGQQQASLRLPDRVFLSDIAPDGRSALTLSADGKCRLYDLATGKIVRTYLTSTADPSYPKAASYHFLAHSAAISPDGQLVARGTPNGTIYLFDLATGRLRNTLRGYTESLTTVQFAQNDQRIVIVSESGMRWTWDLPAGWVRSSQAEAPRLAEAWLGKSQDGKLGVAAGNEGKLELWDLETQSRIKPLGDDEGYFSVVFSQDASKILLLREANIKAFSTTDVLWDLEANQAIQSYQKPDGGKTTCAAISPDGRYILLGSYEGGIHLRDAPSGRLIHSFQGAAAPIRAVAFSADSKKIIAASSAKDGTATIWDIPKKEKIASLIALDGGNWVVTSPNGLFDASQKATELLFYKINYEQQTEVIELEQLKTRYYEPGLLQKLLGFSDERPRPVEGLDAIPLYPEVAARIDADQLLVSLKERNGGIGRVTVFANGKEVVADANESGATRSTLDLVPVQKYLYRHPDSTNYISLRAYNREGWLKSPAIVLRYIPEKWARGEGSTGTDTPALSGDPSLYVLTIGTSEYTGDELDLKYADKDAYVMARAVQSVGAQLFAITGEVAAYCLSTDKTMEAHAAGDNINWRYATKENIQAAFAEIQQKARPQDVILVYLSGHGLTYGSAENAQFYYLTQGISNGDLSDTGIRNKFSISTEEFTRWLNAIPALKQVLVIDACNSGKIIENLTSGSKSLNASQIRALDRMQDRTGMFVLSGSASDKVSYEASEYGQGLLTYALLKGMLGVATKTDKDGRQLIDVMTLFQHARDEVPRLAASINGIQTPMLGFPTQGASFDIGIFNERVDIPLSGKKPVLIRSNLLNQQTLKDDLLLVDELEKLFRAETEKGSAADFLYVDVNEYPGAYYLTGLYQKSGEDLTINIKLFKGEAEVPGFEVRPANDPGRLARMIVGAVKKAIVE